MKNITKYILIAIAIFIAFLVICIVINNNVNSKETVNNRPIKVKTETNNTLKEQYTGVNTEVNNASEDEPSSSNVDTDESTGTTYINNEIIIIIETSATQEDIDKLFNTLNATIDNSMADILIYKLTFQDAMTYDEINTLIETLKSNKIVEDAYPNTIIEFEY